MNDTKTCGNCINCYKETDDDWTCETYGFFYAGAPVHCEPPNDEACKFWTDDISKKNIWEKFV